MEDLSVVIKSFELHPGDFFIISHSANIQASRNKRDFPATPMILQIFKGRDGVFYEKEPGGLVLVRSFGVFIPNHVFGGDKLRLLWVDENCACAVHPADYEKAFKDL